MQIDHNLISVFRLLSLSRSKLPHRRHSALKLTALLATPTRKHVRYRFIRQPFYTQSSSRNYSRKIQALVKNGRALDCSRKESPPLCLPLAALDLQAFPSVSSNSFNYPGSFWCGSCKELRAPGRFRSAAGGSISAPQRPHRRITRKQNMHRRTSDTRAAYPHTVLAERIPRFFAKQLSLIVNQDEGY